MWTGQKEVGKAIDQLDGYLTWRDCKTALIYFVRRKDFLNTLESAEAALRAYDSMRNVMATQIKALFRKNHVYITSENENDIRFCRNLFFSVKRKNARTS